MRPLSSSRCSMRLQLTDKAGPSLRFLLIAIVLLGLGADATFAQTPPRTFPFLSPLRLHDSAVVDCMQMWDSATHMTKQEWSRTCKRVQARVDSLDVNASRRVRKTQR